MIINAAWKNLTLVQEILYSEYYILDLEPKTRRKISQALSRSVEGNHLWGFEQRILNIISDTENK